MLVTIVITVKTRALYDAELVGLGGPTVHWLEITVSRSFLRVRVPGMVQKIRIFLNPNRIFDPLKDYFSPLIAKANL